MEYLPLELCQALKDAGYPQNEKPRYAWCQVQSEEGAWKLLHIWGNLADAWPQVACPYVLSVLEWLEREHEVFWRRSPDLPHNWKAWVPDTRGQHTEFAHIRADNPIDLIRDILAHLQAVQPQEAQP